MLDILHTTKYLSHWILCGMENIIKVLIAGIENWQEIPESEFRSTIISFYKEGKVPVRVMYPDGTKKDVVAAKYDAVFANSFGDKCTVRFDSIQKALAHGLGAPVEVGDTPRVFTGDVQIVLEFCLW